MNKMNKKTNIRIGTDCSGIEAPIEALKKILEKYKNIDFTHKFSSETNEYAIKYINENHNPEILFGDIQKRDINDIPDIDLYVSGFPCQPFSRANKFKTAIDPRLNLFTNCLDVIKTKNPKLFILENVKTLVTLNKGSYFNDILEQLEKNGKYNVFSKVLNTKDYGIPQSRERLYIIGIRKDKNKDKDKKNEFLFPEKKPMRPLKEFIDEEDNSTYKILDSNKELLNRVPKNAVFIDVGFREAKFPKSDRWAPCITAQPNMWCVPKRRKANVKEYLMLQGFPTNVYHETISDHQMKIRIGNSMTVDVIEEILLSCFKSMGIIRK